ncbi:MAG: hypothetical protein ACLQGT_10070 [Terracidiphilus sp.]
MLLWKVLCAGFRQLCRYELEQDAQGRACSLAQVWRSAPTPLTRPAQGPEG